MSAPEADPRLPAVFVGSSSESLHLCHHIQAELPVAVPCEVTIWTQGVFGPSSYTLDELLKQARAADFAILVASADDAVTRRGEETRTARDNVIFELGLFFGVLGRERTFILNDRSGGDLELPSDLAGLTYLPYRKRQDGNERAAAGSAIYPAAQTIKKLGRRPRVQPDGGVAPAAASSHERPDGVVEQVCRDAIAQGWQVKTNSATTLRLVSPRGKRHTLSHVATTSEEMGQSLRAFLNRVRADGLRVNRSARQAALSVG